MDWVLLLWDYGQRASPPEIRISTEPHLNLVSEDMTTLPWQSDQVFIAVESYKQLKEETHLKVGIWV